MAGLPENGSSPPLTPLPCEGPLETIPVGPCARVWCGVLPGRTERRPTNWRNPPMKRTILSTSDFKAQAAAILAASKAKRGDFLRMEDVGGDADDGAPGADDKDDDSDDADDDAQSGDDDATDDDKDSDKDKKDDEDDRVDREIGRAHV